MPGYGGYAQSNNGGNNYKGGKSRNSGPRGGGNRRNTRGNGSGDAPKSFVLVMVLILGVPFLLFLASLGYVVLS